MYYVNAMFTTDLTRERIQSFSRITAVVAFKDILKRQYFDLSWLVL